MARLTEGETRENMSVVERCPAPDEKYARVMPVWRGEPAVIIGGGPSLTRVQVEACRDFHCIAVNDSYLWAPWAEVLYFADSKWHRWQVNGVDGKGRPALGLDAKGVKEAFRSFAGVKVSIDNSMHSIPASDALFLRNANNSVQNGRALSENPCFIATGHNSGFQALNIASLAGATPIILIGIDGKRGEGGKKHFFGEHPDGTDPPYESIRRPFALAAQDCGAMGIDVVNCSPGTLINAFRLAKLEDEIARLVAAQAPALVPG